MKRTLLVVLLLVLPATSFAQNFLGSGSNAVIAPSTITGYPSDSTKFLNGGGAWSVPSGTSYSTFAANSNLGTGTPNGVITASSANADTVPLGAGNMKLTLTANETLTIAKGTISPAASATNIYLFQMEICQNNTGNFTLAFAAGSGITNFRWAGSGSNLATVGQPGYTLTANNGDWYTATFDGTSLVIRETTPNVPC